MLYKEVSVKLKDLKPLKRINWSEKQLNLKDKIINLYNPINGIIVSNGYKILDGNHRYYILLNHYGLEHEIVVRKVPIGQAIYIIFGLIITLAVLPILIARYLVKSAYNKII